MKKKSGRDGFIVYMGKDIMPRVYNLLTDPQERDNVLFPNTWVPRVALPLLNEHVASLKKNPPIKAGQPDPYKPPK